LNFSELVSGETVPASSNVRKFGKVKKSLSFEVPGVCFAVVVAPLLVRGGSPEAAAGDLASDTAPGSDLFGAAVCCAAESKEKTTRNVPARSTHLTKSMVEEKYSIVPRFGDSTVLRSFIDGSSGSVPSSLLVDANCLRIALQQVAEGV
jgi:hypothetical protein